MFVKTDPLGNPVDRAPVEPDDDPEAAEARLRRQVHLGDVAALVRRRTGDHLALDTGGGPLARLWATALGRAWSTSATSRRPAQRQDQPAEDGAQSPRSSSSGRSRSGATPSSATGRAPTSRPTRPRLRAALREKALARCAPADQDLEPFKVPDEAIGCGFHEAVRGVLSHHVVIRDGKIANYHPYPPTPWNASPRDIYGTPGPYEDAVQNTPIFEENGPDNFKGIDIMRAVRSFDPCLPCGVHMYLGNGNSKRESCRRSKRCAPTWTRTGATSSCSASKAAWCGSSFRVVARRALRRR
jgi:hydrogenase large subunit